MTFEPRDFRDALGRFATGVTIVTAANAAGAPVGVTVSSYNSVSLDPPLVLWSLARTAQSLDIFRQAGGYVIHVLGRHQQDLALRFARSGGDKFADLPFDQNESGAPLLLACAARFECAPAYMHDGGDHVIFVGRVLRFDKSDRPPLIFHQGAFTSVRGKTDGPGAAGRYTDDFLPYLLARSRAQLHDPVLAFRQRIGRPDGSRTKTGSGG
jgi:3-hydroxy-9,10-secoandrosta-1,3,5(10)-triene-9,17-dione monooxygenase reductase component